MKSVGRRVRRFGSGTHAKTRRSGHDELPRQQALAASAAAATVGCGATGSASAETDGTSGAEPIPCLDVTGLPDEMETVEAASVAPATASGIGPGSFLLVSHDGTTAGCTANFVRDSATGDVYLGAAGHCFLPGDSRPHGASAAPAERGDSSGLRRLRLRRCDGPQGGRVVEPGGVAYARQFGDGAGRLRWGGPGLRGDAHWLPGRRGSRRPHAPHDERRRRRHHGVAGQGDDRRGRSRYRRPTGVGVIRITLRHFHIEPPHSGGRRGERLA